MAPRWARNGRSRVRCSAAALRRASPWTVCRSPTRTSTAANTISSTLGNGAGTLALAKTGAGTWVVSGNNGFGGAVAVNAGTLVAAGQTVMEEGAKRVFATATHPVFSGGAYENLAGSPFEQIVVTDTIPLRAGAPENIRVLSCADLLTTSIRQIFTDGSVSEVFGGENQLF